MIPPCPGADENARRPDSRNLWSGIEAVITGLTRNRESPAEHGCGKNLTLQGFAGNKGSN